MNKMCGNCGKTDHKYVDCPYIDMQFPPTKKEYIELKEKASKWDNLELDEEDKDIALHGAKLIKQNQKLRELIEKRIKNCHTIKNGYDYDGNDYLLQSEFQEVLEDSKK